jgi:hypothetical protein
MPKTRERLGLSRVVATIGAIAAVGAIAAPAATAAGTTSSRKPVRPVIGRPTATPAQPLPGERFVVSFKVTRSDTGTPVAHAKMKVEASAGGTPVKHSDSFKAGVARSSLAVPLTAQGRTLRVKLTIGIAGRSATKVASYQKAISFDVAADLGSVTHLAFTPVLTCPSIGLTLSDQVLDLGEESLQLSPDWKFGVSGTATDQGAVLTLQVTGALAAPGTATGTLRVDFSTTASTARPATCPGTQARRRAAGRAASPAPPSADRRARGSLGRPIGLERPLSDRDHIPRGDER